MGQYSSDIHTHEVFRTKDINQNMYKYLHALRWQIFIDLVKI